MPARYILDPGTGLFFEESIGPSYQVPLEDLTNGRYRVTGNQVRDSLAGNRVIAGVAPVRGSSLLIDDEGNYWLTNGTSPSDVNRPAERHQSWAAEIVTAETPYGPLEIPEGRNTVWLTAFDRLLYVRNVVNPARGDYTFSAAHPRTGEYGWDVPRGFRLATPREAIEYGLAGWLWDNSRALLSTIIGSGITDDFGNRIESFTDAAHWLAARLDVSGARLQFLPRGVAE